MIRDVIKKSCLYVNSKCPDKDADVTMLIKEIQEEVIKGLPEEKKATNEHGSGYGKFDDGYNQYRQEAIEGIRKGVRNG